MDTWRLFSGEDPDYELWLYALVERVSETKRREYERAKAKGGKRGN